VLFDGWLTTNPKNYNALQLYGVSEMKATESLVAVLFADVAGSTRFYDAFGDVKAKQMVDECMVAMRSVLNQYGGRVVKTIGDELMCVLQDAQKACLAATDMQLKITSLPVVEGQQRAIRIGFHAGMVIHQDNDVFGDTVNLAARMTGLAKGGQIMTTAATVLQLPNLLRSSTRKIAALSIKGKEGDIEVCEVIWQAGDELTMATPSTFQANRLMQLSLTFHGEHCVMGSSFTKLEMGRDATCHFAVSDKKASRQHAYIELRQEKFFLIDQSTNGTFVLFDGEPEITLRREQVMLQGTGRISFGRSLQDASEDIVSFCVEDAL